MGELKKANDKQYEDCDRLELVKDEKSLQKLQVSELNKYLKYCYLCVLPYIY